MKAVIKFLTGKNVELKVYCDNNAAMAIGCKEGVGRIKHLGGRLLWLQQRQNKDLQLRRIDTATNPADISAKILGGKRVRLLLKLMGFTNDFQDLGEKEFEDEKVKKEAKERLRVVRKVVFANEETGERQSSTMMNQVAKHLMRLTLGALLLDVGEALGQSSNQCLVVAEPSTMTWILSTTIFILAFVIVILLLVIFALLATYKNAARQSKMAREIMINMR